MDNKQQLEQTPNFNDGSWIALKAWPDYFWFQESTQTGIVVVQRSNSRPLSFEKTMMLRYFELLGLTVRIQTGNNLIKLDDFLNVGTRTLSYGTQTLYNYKADVRNWKIHLARMQQENPENPQIPELEKRIAQRQLVIDRSDPRPITNVNQPTTPVEAQLSYKEKMEVRAKNIGMVNTWKRKFDQLQPEKGYSIMLEVVKTVWPNNPDILKEHEPEDWINLEMELEAKLYDLQQEQAQAQANPGEAANPNDNSPTAVVPTQDR